MTTPSTAHGTPKLAVIAHAENFGPATRHGRPIAVYTPVTVGVTVLQASSSGVVTKHGTPTAKGTVSLQASGQPPATQHGTPAAIAVLRVSGHLATAHGTPKAAAVAGATGHCGTRHGVGKAVAVLRASGHLATRHGTPGSTSTAVLQAHGHTSTAHGVPRVGALVLHAYPTPPFVRHGRPTISRGLQC